MVSPVGSFTTEAQRTQSLHREARAKTIASNQGPAGPGFFVPARGAQSLKTAGLIREQDWNESLRRAILCGMSRSVPMLVVLAVALPLFGGFSQTQDFRPATPAELAMTSVDYAPGVPAAILDWVEVDDDTRSISSEYYRIKVFSDEGKKYADVEVAYLAGYPFHGRVTDISARTIQPDGTIVPFDGKVYDKVVYKAGGVRLRAKTFSLAGVKAGSILEYRYQRRWADMMLLNTIWTVQREIPVLRARMSLKPYDSNGLYTSFFTYFNLPPGKVPAKGERGLYELELTNVPMWQEEAFAPPEGQLQARVNFYYTASDIDAKNFWANMAGAWSKDVEAFMGKPQHLQAHVTPLAGKDPLETARNIYAKVQSLRNLSFEDEPTADDKKNAAAVLGKGEGYRRELNRTFVALARAAGLDASVMRVSPRDEFFFAQNIPDAEQMSAEIAVVTIDGTNHFVDPGTPTAPFGIVSWEKANTPGFRLAKLGKGQQPQMMMVPEQKVDDAVVRRVADVRLNGESIEGSVTATFLGQEALSRRLESWGEDEATRTKALEDEAKTWFPDGATVKLKELNGATSHTEPLIAKFDVTLTNVVSSAGSRTLLPISIFESTARNPFASATRTHPVYYPHPRREEDEVKLTLPETLALATPPPPAKLDAGVLKYSNETKLNGQEVTFKRTHTVDVMLVEKQHYNSLRNFYSSMISADQKPLVLVTR